MAAGVAHSAAASAAAPSPRLHLGKARPHFLKNTNLASLLQPAADDDDGSRGFTATKLIATCGPSSHTVDQLASLLEAGCNVFRVDLAWGSLDYHRRTLDNLGMAMRRVKRIAAIMVDTLGREMMIKRPYTFDETGWPSFPESLPITAGQALVITARDGVEATPQVLPITYARFPSLVSPGDKLYLGRYLVCGAADQGSLYLEVR